jgi:serine/threonine-protein phosphatase 2A regulatory subunit A
MVRRGAAQSISILANHLEKEHAKEYMLPLLKQLLLDENDSVKIHAVYSSVPVAKLVSDDAQLIKDEIIPAFKASVDNEGSWRLRFAVVEMGASLAEYVTKEIADEDIVGFYKKLMEDKEAEVRSEAIGKLPLLSKYCSSEAIVDKILPIISKVTIFD